MNRELSVSELAQRIAAPRVASPSTGRARDVAFTLRRLRHWTLSGTLPTIGDPHTGPGRSRCYGPDAVYLAAVLDVLADLGLGIGALKACSSYIQNLTAGNYSVGTKPWRTAISGRETIYLVFVLQSRDLRHFPESSAFAIETADEIVRMKGMLPGKGRITVNLTDIFRRFRP